MEVKVEFGYGGKKYQGEILVEDARKADSDTNWSRKVFTYAIQLYEDNTVPYSTLEEKCREEATRRDIASYDPATSTLYRVTGEDVRDIAAVQKKASKKAHVVKNRAICASIDKDFGVYFSHPSTAVVYKWKWRWKWLGNGGFTLHASYGSWSSAGSTRNWCESSGACCSAAADASRWRS